MTPTYESRHIGVRIDRPAGVVYDYAADPTNLPSWASGLSTSVELVDGTWTAASPMGPITFVFAARNECGVLDHDVTLPTGDVFHNPLRVIANGGGSEVVFTLLRRPEVSDADFERDAATITSDLQTLKRILEG
jgi:hypothetical protein